MKKTHIKKEGEIFWIINYIFAFDFFYKSVYISYDGLEKEKTHT